MSLLTTGTSLSIHAWGSYLDLYIQASADDYSFTEGLCGSFDGNKDNDFIHNETTYMTCPNSWGEDARTPQAAEFGKSWRYESVVKIFYKL